MPKRYSAFTEKAARNQGGKTLKENCSNSQINMKCSYKQRNYIHLLKHTFLFLTFRLVPLHPILLIIVWQVQKQQNGLGRGFIVVILKRNCLNSGLLGYPSFKSYVTLFLECLDWIILILFYIFYVLYITLILVTYTQSSKLKMQLDPDLPSWKLSM